jgi:GTP cyclohydrolase I
MWNEDAWRETQECIVESHAEGIIAAIDPDPQREGLQETPARMIRSLRELTRGYDMHPSHILAKMFHVEHDELISVLGIPFWSLCEHHVLPFYGQVDVGYLPKGQVVGLSKIPRLVECFARRLQIQEQMTEQIAHAMQEHLDCSGVIVVARGHHLCMKMRGIQSDAEMVTSCLTGQFKTDKALKGEFLALSRKEPL